MENIQEFFEILLNSEKLIHYGGLVLLLIVIFAETGVFFGFIFPGDALLFTAGLLCGTKDLEVPILLLVLSVAVSAVCGNIAGFATGKYFGKRLFQKKDTFFFKQRHLEKSNAYYEKYGGIALIGGRFLPVIRTFVPILAGAIDMNFWKFTLYNITGAVLWSGTIIPIGYFIGKKFPTSLDHLEYIILGITLVTMTILIRGIIRMKKK
ncbi:MAG: DedA family protein [Bacteroidales bacterium]|jgi:membrane-associated protein|nr:DedA family protein [Bacteroidales bacterium]